MTKENLPTNPARIKAFASYFKNYMGVSSIVIAALPVPLTMMNVIPTFIDMRLSLATYTTLFCFLSLAFIFYLRHFLSGWIFSRILDSDDDEKAGIISLCVIILSITSFTSLFLYHNTLSSSMLEIYKNNSHLIESPNVSCKGVNFPYPKEWIDECTSNLTRQDILEKSYISIESEGFLRFFYILIFVSAEAAFILMATKEYLQEILDISEVEAILGIMRPESNEQPND